MKDPLVSIVIPAYNAAEFIEKTLDSVDAQTFRDFEVVVIDDGSTDDTHAVANAYLSRKKMAGRCLRQPNGKIAAARNAGMRSARGAYIALLDHDDLWIPEKLEVVMEEFKRRPEAALICHNENVTKNGNFVRLSRNGPACARMYERLLFKGNALSPSASVFRKDVALSIGGFRENPEFNTVEDYDFWMRLSKAATFYFIDRVLGQYQLVERAASARIEYHHGNLEALLKDHFASYYGPHPGWMARLRMNRRLSAVYRSALGQLMQRGESAPLQSLYLSKMLRHFPVGPKNLWRAALWVKQRAPRA